MTDLLYTDIEESLRSSVRQVLQRRFSSADVAAHYDDTTKGFADVWSELSSDVGVAALMIPEEFGGAGAGAREAAVVSEELGSVVAPVPYLTSSVIAATVLSAARASKQLVDLSEGMTTATLVVPWTSRRGHWPVGTGSVRLVAGAIESDTFIVPLVSESGLQLRVFDRSDVEVDPLTSLDMSRQLSVVRWHGAGELIAQGEEARLAVDAGLLAGQALLASEQFAVAKWCLETTVEYAKTRIQFARPIGSFQAIKHRLADLYQQVVQAQAAARYAADTLSRNDDDRFAAAAIAQSYCSDVSVKAAEEALQLHGGIAMTWEHPIHLYLKRAKSDQLALGTPSQHRADLAQLVNLPQEHDLSSAAPSTH